MVDNVITVSIGNSRKITTRPAWLTDKGMILRFVGVDLPNYYVVDFARSLTEQALPVIGTPEGVAIPPELFHNSDKIFAWLRLTQGDNVHYTVYQITIPLQQRSEISNVQPTPEQEDIIDQAIAVLNAAVEQTGQDVESAAASAAAAIASEQAASASEVNAAGSESAAAGSASAALASQNAAAQYATAAANSESAASAFADTASTKATAAANSATAASDAATTATTKAGEAATSATNAANSANTANTKAGEASASATAASGSASTASTKAGEASASATAAAGSATAASSSATSSNTNALKSEGYAIGKQGGVDVDSNSPYYQNNSKYYADEAASVAASIPEDYSKLSSDVSDLNGYFEKGINLFNPDDPDLVENVELKNNGTTAAKNGYFASGFYPVKPGQTVCLNYPIGTYGKSSNIVLYDENKSRIGYTVSVERLTDNRGYSYIRYTMPQNATAKYFRVTGHMAGEPYYMYVYAAEMPSTYVPYTDKVTLSDDVVVPFENMEGLSVTKADTNFIEESAVNLVDFSQMIPGILTSSTSNGNVDTSGNYGSNWKTTDYIEVEPGETYALCIFPGVNYGANFKGVACYDKDKNFLVRVTQSGGSVGSIALRETITIPTNTSAPVKYLRTSYYTSYVTNPKRWWYCQIFKASTWPGDLFVPYDGGEHLDSIRMDNAVSCAYNPLFGKSAMWNGDSICAADNDTSEGGWPGRIAKTNRMKFKNYAIAGGTIAENTGTYVHSVSATLDTMISDFPNADYIIIEGGTNDADIIGDAGIGTYDPDDFSAAYISALDKDTFSGALESIFYRLVTQMKGKHIGYLIPQKMGHTAVLVARRRTYFDRAINICKKWGIPYLDLWNGYYFNWELSAHWDQTMTTAENEAAGNLYLDGQHLTTTGYAIESPIIAEWMKTI